MQGDNSVFQQKDEYLVQRSSLDDDYFLDNVLFSFVLIENVMNEYHHVENPMDSAN